MNIHFVGDLKSPFIQQDLDLLKEDHTATTFDLSKLTFSRKNAVRYLITTALQWNEIRKSDVVWIWFADYPILPFVVLGKLFLKPVIVTIGGWEVSAQKEIEYGNQLNPIRGAVTRWILRNCNACICLSEYYQRLSKTIEPRANVIVIPGWIDTRLCEEPTPKKHGVVTALFAVTPTTLILKGIPTFREATKGLESEVLTGVPHNKLIETFKGAKVYCQLSYSESFGMALLEAMACGCIPIVSNREALPEMIKGCGLVVPYGDVEKTRESIMLALKAGAADVVAVRKRAALFTKERKKIAVAKLLREL